VPDGPSVNAIAGFPILRRSQILEFLAQELSKMSSHSSLNTIKSVISLISHDEIGNHPLIKRFCRGVAVIISSQPSYDYVWDSVLIISKLTSIFPYETISLKIITKKLVLLLALGTGHRAQTLQAIRISQIFLGEKLIIRIPDRIKTSAPGRSQPLFFFSHFNSQRASVSSGSRNII